MLSFGPTVNISTLSVSRHHLGMALIDFYGLIALYELRCSDAAFSSIPSRSLMSSARSSRSPPPSEVEPDGARSSLSSTRPEFKTPGHKRGVSHPVPEVTPLSIESATRQTQEAGADRVGKFERADYDVYIREDVGSRVFIDFEVFMKRVLYVPDDWRSAWGPAIEAVKADPTFKHHHEYYSKCNNSDTQEDPFYIPLMETANAALSVLSRLTFGDVSPGVPQCYRVSDPKKLRGGAINKSNLSPDIVVLHKACRPSTENLHWANPLHILEVKPYDSTIFDASDVPRLVVDGKAA